MEVENIEGTALVDYKEAVSSKGIKLVVLFLTRWLHIPVIVLLGTLV